MNLDQIHYFLAIVETESFTQAAEKLLLSQPSLSSAIKKLERELGVILFDRGGRRTTLTPAGEVFLTKARQILEDYEQALYQLRDFHKQPTLRLGILSTLSIASVAGLIRCFRQEHPDIILELRSSHADDLDRCLAEKEIDLAITALNETDNTETSLTLFNQHFLLGVPSIHPFAQREIINLNELDNQPYIQRINCEFWRADPLIYESAGVYPNMIYRADCEEWVIALIQAGFGMSVMPEWKNLSNVVYVDIEEMNLERTVGLKWNSKHNLNVVSLFCDLAAQQDWQLALANGFQEVPLKDNS
ncbi:MAG: LysR family transcriptional regulator [Crocosphaera sp.]|nr:LysR family transcriptional regulator [Crocosphaera sp.]